MPMNKTEICNQALLNIEHGRQINSLNESSVEARYCNRIYDTSRRTLLGMHIWTFAKTSKVLSLTGATAPTGWEYEYDYPQGCVSAVEIARTLPSEDKKPFTTGSTFNATTGADRKVIWTNEENAELIYIRDVTQTANFQEIFGQALAGFMGWQLSKLLAKKESVKKGAWDWFQWALNEAIRTGAIEAQDVEEPEPDWIADR